MSLTTTRSHPQLRAVLFIAALFSVGLFGPTVREAWSQFGNPPMCTNPTVNIEIEEFRDLNTNGMIDAGEPQLFPFTLKAAGEQILYRARLSHTGSSRCGFEAGRACIDLPQIGCNGGPTFNPPSFTTVGPGECCAVDIGNAVPLVCDPVTCNPPGVAEYISNPIAYTVNPADDANNKGLCPLGTLRANAFYDDGFSKQGAEPGIKPANASIPICNPVVVEAAHFMCYEPLKRPVGLNVTLVDRFRSVTARVGDLKRICNPADKNDEDPNAPLSNDHLTFYEINTPAFTKVSVETTNQFGTATYQLTRATRLMVPTNKDLLALPGPVSDPAPLDHYTCYVTKGLSAGENVKVDDQFGTLQVEVKQPDLVCVPANKNNEGFVNPNGADGAGFVCYDVNTVPKRQDYTGPIFINNQFTPVQGQGPLELHGPRELCLQSSIRLLVP